MKTIFKIAVCLLATLTTYSSATAQLQMGGNNKRNSSFGSSNSQDYTIGGITVSGSKFIDEELLVSISGLTPGSKLTVPNDQQLSKAIRNLWKQKLFSDVEINATRFVGNKIFLDIKITERPRLSKFNFIGIKQNDAKDLKGKLDLVKNRVITESTKKSAAVRIKKYYADKGHINTKVNIIETKDTAFSNMSYLTFVITKGPKIKINQVNIFGNEYANTMRLKRTMKESKEMARLSIHPVANESVYGKNDISARSYFKNKGFLSLSKTAQLLDPYFRYKVFSASKFNDKKFEKDKRAIVQYYNSIGFRDARIEKDTTYFAENGHLNIDVLVDEGNKYYFGDFDFKGNTKYSEEQLTKLLGIKKGDVFNQELLDKRLGKIPTQESDDISSLYLDDGYLAFNTNVTEKSVIGDTINFNIQLMEGDQYTIRNVNISGNDRTHEHVIRRELRTLPGNKFSRSDIIRSQREISNLGFFDAEKIGITPKPNNDGTVDIDYTVVEKSSDQLELQAGFGGGLGITGTVGVSFNNFSLKNMTKKGAWDPLPMGDGQKLSLRGQANGRWYNSITASFTEPWLGGKKPTALSLSAYRTYFAGTFGSTEPGNMTTLGLGMSISKRLRWPDDNFIISYGLNYQRYNINDYNFFEDPVTGDFFNNGQANNLSLKITLARSSIDQPLYPRSGSSFRLSAQFTPPYSSFNDINYETAGQADRYKWIEYHKYRFNAEWYQRIKGNLVLKLATKHGYLGSYDPAAQSPFERFQVGGDGIQGFTIFGRDIIAHRGYEIYTDNGGATIFNKYTAELRYPLSLNPSSTIYALGWYEAANAWNGFKQFNPFELNRATGMGIRIFLPMFGLLGLDYGVRLDEVGNSPAIGNGTKFSAAAKFTFMLGQEPE